MKAIAEIQLADCFAERCAIRHHDSTKSDLAFFQEKVFVYSISDDALELLQTRARSNDRQPVVAVNHGGISRRDSATAMADARNRDTRFDSPGNRIHAKSVEVGIRDEKS